MEVYKIRMERLMVEEVSKQVPIYAETDICVIGGGIAGISAALSAAREHKKVTLIEKSCVLGGMATLGNVCIYLPLCDGYGNKVFGGLAEELLHTSIRYGYNNLPVAWQMGTQHVQNAQGRYMTYFNVPAAILAFDELLRQEGVEIVYDAVFSEVIMEENICKGVILESKEGRIAYLATIFIDASGDADVFYRAGAKCEKGENVLSQWCHELTGETLKAGMTSYQARDSITLCRLGPHPHTRDARLFSGISLAGINDWLACSRKMLLDHLKDNQTADYAMMSIPWIAQFRTTRRIMGREEFSLAEPDKYHKNSVGCVCYSSQRSSPVYEFPYGAILDDKIHNIAAAGRIVAAKNEAWDVMRTIPACAFTGQVAGSAAALALMQKISLQRVKIEDLQHCLQKNGVIIHIPEFMKGKPLQRNREGKC